MKYEILLLLMAFSMALAFLALIGLLVIHLFIL